MAVERTSHLAEWDNKSSSGCFLTFTVNFKIKIIGYAIGCSRRSQE